jgi:hypothetical protein
MPPLRGFGACATKISQFVLDKSCHRPRLQQISGQKLSVPHFSDYGADKAKEENSVNYPAQHTHSKCPRGAGIIQGLPDCDNEGD